MYLADGHRGTLDPAFDAHGLPIYMWCLALSQSWQSPQLLERVAELAAHKVLEDGVVLWARVAGPAAALIASITRVGWTMQRGRHILTDLGESLDLLLDLPKVVMQAMHRAVRRWRLRRIGVIFPHLIPPVPDLVIPRREGDGPLTTFVLDYGDVLHRLAHCNQAVDERLRTLWQPSCKAYLRSTITGGAMAAGTGRAGAGMGRR